MSPMEKTCSDYSTALTKLCYILTRCIDCNIFPCNIFNAGSENLSSREYSCLRRMVQLLEITRRKQIDYHVAFCGLLSRIMPKGLVTLEKIVNLRYTIARLCLDDSTEAARCVLESMGLGRIISLLEDEDIEDIYITDSGIYIVRKGLRIERFNIDRSSLMKLMRRFVDLAFLAGHDLNFDIPSALYSLNIGDVFRLRVSVDTWPCVEGVVIHLRVHRKPYTIDQLAKLGLASRTLLRRIVRQVRDGLNLLIVGPPGSGKTTLLNAILLDIVRETPSMKIVCIDEADEIWLPNDVLALKYRSIYGRVREVERMLHRGGGLLVIGELREKEHYEAFNIGLRSGLQVLATIHGRSIDDVLSKFEKHGIIFDGAFIVLGFVEGCRRIIHVSVPMKPLSIRLS